MIVFIIIAFITTASATNSTKDLTTESPNNATKEILKASETADAKKVEIVKQIRRLNEDGSYTIGYEADDGTFKIENRDVLGNVKGTFGYIDQDGEIKRVTYTSSSDSTPVPVTTSTTPSTPTIIVRMNKTVSSTTRRPLGTIVYPTRGSPTTRGTVIQAIPRRRAHASTTRVSHVETTTEPQKPEETTSNILNLYKPKLEDVKTRTQILKPMSAGIKDDLVTRQTTTNIPSTLKPVYEEITEKDQETDVNKANTIRRELIGTSPNPRMISLQQSVGDDSTDVYGSHLSMGTVRPLFTTTTPRPRLVPIQSLVAARQKIRQQYQDVPVQEQETTIEASTGRVFDQDSVVTSNPVPIVHIRPQLQSEQEEEVYQHPIYQRPPAAIHFRTREYLRDNPGAPVPIGNQRQFLQYEFQNKALEPPYDKEPLPPPPKVAETSNEHYEMRPVTRIIPIPVDERGVPIQGYQARFVNPYRPQPSFQPRYNPVDEMTTIAAPVSTRDLRRLLHILILRQNRLQALMDQMMLSPPLFRPDNDYRYQKYQDDDRYDYRYDQYRQEYRSQGYENQYDSQRYVPRRRLYARQYDTTGASSNHIEDMPEFLPPEIREALLLKMLILAISPDFMPTVTPLTEMTTAAPPRKQVRNIQILGEEGSSHPMEDKRPRH